MTHLEIELEQLKKAIIEMMDIVKNQLEKSRTALLSMDTDIAQEIIHNEIRINALELSIDRDCENIFALFNPVAIDLRFILSILKINSDLERIGDLAEGIAKFALELESSPPKNLLTEIRFNEMFELTINMLDNVIEGFIHEDTKIARQVFKKDKILNQINKDSPRIISEFVEKDPQIIKPSLYFFSVIRKLERIGDLTKNIAEDIIFHIEAKVLKHKNAVKKIKKIKSGG
ncbi:MAG: phosphate signaling complex protein PhoU [Bacteroidetes bacterium]|nr:phosphate signaling complex protein PhoU [Bacteroidota bacterium]